MALVRLLWDSGHFEVFPPVERRKWTANGNPKQRVIGLDFTQSNIEK
ncbi:hypothetical protein [Falsihalocynthiibacter arcticus]|nr:hypothetical protein [Falsihalocynthiibacter arcticus]